MPFGQRIVFANRWLFAPVIKQIMAKANSSNATLRTTTAPTLFNAGVKDNVLPIDATATVNFRILPGETINSVAERVKEVIDNDQVRVKVINNFIGNPPPISSASTPGFGIIHRTIKSVFPDAIVAPYLVLGATDSRFYTRICPNVYRFSPIRMNDEDTQRLHGTNERISTKDYQNMIRFYVALVRSSQ